MSAEVIELFKKKPKNWIEAMDYAELLREQDYIRSEIRIVGRALNAVCNIDKRGAIGPEVSDVLKSLGEFDKGYRYILEEVQKEMIKRMKAGL